MPPKCDLGDCSLDDTIKDMKLKQEDQHKIEDERYLEQATFQTKIEGYIEQGIKDHKLLFERTSGVVKWRTLVFALVSLITISAGLLKLIEYISKASTTGV